jgi:hypothetical protein
VAKIRALVAEQVHVDSPASAVVSLLEHPDRRWLQSLGRLALGEVAPDQRGAWPGRLRLGPRLAALDIVTFDLRWSRARGTPVLRAFRGQLAVRPAAEGVALAVSGICELAGVEGNARSNRPHEAVLRSLLGHLRNLVEALPPTG